MTPDIYLILKIGIATGDNVLESLRLKAEGACKCIGYKAFVESFLSYESIVYIFDYKVKDVFWAYCNEP